MFKNFLKKVEEKGKEYTKKTKDYVESEEFKNRVDSIKNKTTAVAKDLESKGKKAVSDFKEKQKSLDGQEIAITGYIIPVDVELNQYVLSAFPFSACFFCGNAGPESVMAVYFAKPDQTFKTDQRVTLSGSLELNDTNVDELVYVLRNATVKE